MSRNEQLIQAVLEDALLSLDELCRAAAVSPQWVRERIADGLLTTAVPQADPPPAPAAQPGQGRTVPQAASGPADAAFIWRFDTVAVRRVQRMARVERDFEALPELAALVADLQDEIDSLRRQLRRRGGS